MLKKRVVVLALVLVFMACVAGCGRYSEDVPADPLVTESWAENYVGQMFSDLETAVTRLEEEVRRQAGEEARARLEEEISRRVTEEAGRRVAEVRAQLEDDAKRQIEEARKQIEEEFAKQLEEAIGQIEEEVRILIEKVMRPPSIGLTVSSLRPGEITLLKVVCPEGAKLELVSGESRRNIPIHDGWALLNLTVTAKEGPARLVLSDKNGVLCEETLEIAARVFGSQYMTTAGAGVGGSDLQTPTDNDYDVYGKKVAEARSVSVPEPLWLEDGFVLPVSGSRVTTEFAYTRYIDGALYSRHSGVDIAAPQGTNVGAAARGVVTLAELLPVTGNTVVIDHGMGLFSLYAHMSSLNVSRGDEVTPGQLIGKVGSTGFSTGPHLHLTFTVNGDICDPFQLVPRP